MSRARPRPIWSITCGRPSWPICSLNLGRNDSAGGSPAGSWKTEGGRPIQTTGQLADLVRTKRPGTGAAWADRPGHPRLPGAADRGQRRARPARRRARGDPRPAGAGRPGRDHQLPFAGRPPRQVGVQDQSQADRPDQETRDRDGPGSGRQPPSAKRQTEGGGAMPEPVVIIGPAARPAGPTGESAENAVEAKAVDSGAEEAKFPKRNDRTRSVLLPTLVRIAGGLFAFMSRLFWAVTRGALNVASRYPRHSLAAAASVLILGAVLYSQLRSGKSARSPVTASIPGESAAVAANSDTNAAVAKVSEVNTGVATKTDSPGAGVKELAKANPDGSTIASSDTGYPSDRSLAAAAPGDASGRRPSATA